MKKTLAFFTQNKIHFFVLGYFLLATIFITYPLIFHLDSLITGVGDELLLTWVMNWNVHSFLTDPVNIFNANIFYPYQLTLAYSDALFTSSFIALIPLMLFHEPVLAFNINLLVTLIMVGFCTYLLVYYLTKHIPASIVSGTLIAFSTFTLTKIFILQLISIQWAILSLLFFLHFLKTKRYRFFLLTCIFFLLQAANNFQGAYFLGFSIFGLTIFRFWKQRKQLKGYLGRNILITSGVTLIVFLLLGLPYLLVSLEFSYSRDIRDTIHFANRPEYTFYPSDLTKLSPLIRNTVYKNDTGPYLYDGYIGLAFFLLIFLTVGFVIWQRRKIKLSYFYPFFLLGGIYFLLSLGPALQWGGRVIKEPFMIPLPYALFYYLVPGFNGFRNSGRWEFYGLFMFSVCIGLVLAFLLKKKSTLFSYALMIISCALVFWEFSFPLHYVSVPKRAEFPEVYSYINTLPKDAAIIELPMFVWYMAPYGTVETYREYFSTVHFRNMVNGYSGFSPPAWERLTQTIMEEFPSRRTVDTLKNSGVEYVIIHEDEFNALEGKTFNTHGREIKSFTQRKNELKDFPELSLVKKIGNDYVYSLENEK